MTETTHQGAVGAETMTAAERVCHEEQMALWSSEIAGRLNMGGYLRDNLTYDDNLDIQAAISEEVRSIVGTAFDLSTPAPRTDGGMTAGEDHAWTFERTRTYLLAELERLRADLHTIGEDLTGEQGKAASWLDVATGRVANVSSVLASATPAQPAGAVPIADGSQIIAHLGPHFHAQPQPRDENNPNWSSKARDHDIYTTDPEVCRGGRLLVGTLSWKAVDAWQQAVGVQAKPPAVPDSLRALSEAAKDVLAERRRQVEVEGWTPEHDDEHRKGELASAAVCYASGLDLWTGHEQADRKGRPTLIGAARVWPWSGWWKPADPRRNLVKAGALILAEIERIDRASHPAGQSAGSGADTLAATLTEFQRRNGYHKREIEELLTEFGELLLSKVVPAPDSTRTGQAEADRQALEQLYDFACTHPNAVGEKAREIDAAYKALAARPAAPEAQEAWRSQAADEIDAIADLWSADGRSYAKTIAAILRAEEPEQLPPADAETKRQVQRAWDRFKAGTPAPPDSSGQGGR